MGTRRGLLRGLAASAVGGVALGTIGAIAQRGALAATLTASWRRLSGQLPAVENPTSWAQTPAPRQVSVNIDLTPGRAISPSIYGVSVAGADQLVATGARVNRWGGNPNTRYNWMHGAAWNAARDWEFRNYGGAPFGGVQQRVADGYVSDTRASGADAWISIPAIGWVAKDSDNGHMSSGVPPDGGPPTDANAEASAGYDPAANRTTTSVRSLARKPWPFADDPAPISDLVFQDEWVHHLVSKFGTAEAGGVRYYAFDNEPDLWSSTHTDVHPVQLTYDDMLAAFLEYATAIKDVDPSAQVTGPTLSGWTALWYSARDRGLDNFRSHADRRAHGDTPFLAWWLARVRQHDEAAGCRSLDFLDVHYYPQAGGVFAPMVGDEATQRLRLRSTRSLWDPTYVDESWISEAVELVPRLRTWRDELYPGTGLAIGEWNWGAEDTLNGALAIANVLGIFGREGIDLASYWTSPKPGSPAAHAFRLYTNYDGLGSAFGDRSLAATSTSPDDVAVYASRDSSTGDGVIVVLNHRPDAAVPTRIQVGPTDQAISAARWFMYGFADPTRIRDMGNVPVSEKTFSLVLGPESASVLRVILR